MACRICRLIEPFTELVDRAYCSARAKGAPNMTGYSDNTRDERGRAILLALVALGITLNVTLGTLVSTWKLPVYLDAVGTIVITRLLGWRSGVAVGVGSFAVSSLLVNPVLIWFSGTQAAIALYVHLVERRGGFATLIRTIVAGIGLGVICGLVSAPVIVYLFGGITGSGPSLIVAFLLASGKSVLNSVVLSGLAAEPLDKALQCLLAVYIQQGLPESLVKSAKGL
jgi:energy-coupling factor transport system substrate-specific component